MSDDFEKQEKPRKRIQVLLTHDIYEEVEKISKLGGVSMGSLLAELLSDSKPALVMIREALEKAKQQDLSGALERIQSGLLDGMGQGVDLAKQIESGKAALKK
jgi:hypothetical protein